MLVVDGTNHPPIAFSAGLAGRFQLSRLLDSRYVREAEAAHNGMQNIRSYDFYELAACQGEGVNGAARTRVRPRPFGSVSPFLETDTYSGCLPLTCQSGSSGWPGNPIVDGTPTIESITKALEETNYGAYVYESTNDVPDNQTTSIRFMCPLPLFQYTSTTSELDCQLHDCRTHILNLYAPNVSPHRTRRSHRRHVHVHYFRFS
jgi:hypothetical protein